MTSDERKTLEALADDVERNGPTAALARDAAAIRAALREVDALTQQVATLTTERDEAHRLAVESKRKMDAAYAHADLIQSEITTATDDCPHPSDTWTTCSACHLKAMRERDAACAQVADLEARAIPKELLDTRRFEIELCWHPLVTGVVARYVKPMANGGWQVEWVSSPADAERVELFPTLSAALSAAKEAP